MLFQLLGLISLYSIYIEELTKDFLEIKMISIEHAIYHAIASLPEVDSNFVVTFRHLKQRYYTTAVLSEHLP